MIKENKYKQFGYPSGNLKKTSITIHNTNNYSMSARELFDYVNNECKTSQGMHLIVDCNEVIEVMPLDWCVYHTGKGNDNACKHSIAIEICSNSNNELYLKGQDKAIKLIKQLMKEYHLTRDDIYFHNDFNNEAYCPSNILNLYGNKENFLNKFFRKDKKK